MLRSPGVICARKRLRSARVISSTRFHHRASNCPGEPKRAMLSRGSSVSCCSLDHQRALSNPVTAAIIRTASAIAGSATAMWRLAGKFGIATIGCDGLVPGRHLQLQRAPIFRRYLLASRRRRQTSIARWVRAYFMGMVFGRGNQWPRTSPTSSSSCWEGILPLTTCWDSSGIPGDECRRWHAYGHQWLERVARRTVLTVRPIRSGTLRLR